MRWPAFIVTALWFVALAPVASGPCAAQIPSTSKGTKQRVANPLNDLLDEARRDIDRQDFEAAIAPLQKFLAEKDDFAYAHFQLGYAYTGLQKSKEARDEYQRAMQLDPKIIYRAAEKQRGAGRIPTSDAARSENAGGGAESGNPFVK